jgi:hypothetical protein
MEKAIHRHYLHHVSGASPMSFPILQRIYPTNQIIHPRIKYLHQKIFALKVNMADQSEAAQSSEKSAISKSEVKVSAPPLPPPPPPEKPLPPPPEKPLPPPPEKPLPGDCCGSGCIRCVWDIYFDELDEYDKLCKSKSDSVTNPKTS